MQALPRGRIPGHTPHSPLTDGRSLSPCALQVWRQRRRLAAAADRRAAEAADELAGGYEQQQQRAARRGGALSQEC
jgi:hypothetical protein